MTLEQERTGSGRKAQASDRMAIEVAVSRSHGAGGVINAALDYTPHLSIISTTPVSHTEQELGIRVRG